MEPSHEIAGRLKRLRDHEDPDPSDCRNTQTRRFYKHQKYGDDAEILIREADHDTSCSTPLPNTGDSDAHSMYTNLPQKLLLTIKIVRQASRHVSKLCYQIVP